MHAWEQRAITAQTERAFAFAARVRAVAVALFLPLVMSLAAMGAPGWAPYVAPLGIYGAFALAVFAARRQPMVKRLGSALFFVDVVMVYVLQRSAMTSSPFPAGVAGFSLGLFVLLALLAGVSMQRFSTLATAVVAAPLQLSLMTQAGVGGGAQASAVVVLLCAGFAQMAFIRRLITMVRAAASHEVAHRLETERAEKLEQARATISGLYADAEERNAALVRAQADKEMLTSLLVHDLRAPLSAVKANLTWLDAEVAVLNDPDVSQAVRESQQVTERLTGMIGDMLNIAKLEANALPLTPEVLLVKPWLDRLARQFASQAKARNITVMVEAEETAFDADKALLTRVLENLLSNALRYTPAHGRVKLEARTMEDHVLLAVRNDGAPIPVHVRPTLFEKFTQGADATENRRVGWGLGLYFCKLSTTSHGGTIDVEDTEGWPTSFVIRLPRRALAQAARAA